MFLSGTIFIGALMIILLLVVWYQRANILDQFSQQLQQRLNVDVQAEELKFGVIRSFPMASVTAKEVRLQSGSASDPVFVQADAESIQLRFNILDIFRKEYRVNRMTIKNGKIIGSFDQQQSYVFFIPGMRLKGSFAASSEWEMGKSSIVYNDHLFETSGTFLVEGNTVWMDAALKGKDFRLESILKEFPEELTKAISLYEPIGNISFITLLRGRITSDETPSIEADFKISEGSIMHPEKGLMLNRVSLKGFYTNGAQKTAKTSTIRLEQIRAATGHGHVAGAIYIQNLKQPLFDIELTADVSAGDFIAWAGIGALQATNGTVKADLIFSGRMNSEMSFSGNELLTSDIQGNLQFRDLNFSTTNSSLNYHDFNGDLYLAADRILLIRTLSGKAGQSDIQLSGTVYNLLPYLFVSDEILYIEAKLDSENILLDELLAQNGQSNEHNTYSLGFPRYLHLALNADIEELSFRRFTANHIKAQTSLINRHLYAKQLTFNTMEGSVLMTGSVGASHDGTIELNTRAHLKGVNIHQLFYQTGNFGQNSIVDENLFGQVTADIDFLSLWTPGLRIKWESMTASASLRIDDGRLVNYQPMQALGRFIRAGDLSDVAFSTLKNEIYIREETVFIPMMEIHSNVLDLELSGEHSFGNKIDYRLRVELSELLSRRHRENRNPQDQFGEIIDDGLGRTTLFLKLTGTTQDVVVRYDQEGLREKLREDFKEERDNLRHILRDEFHFLSRRSIDTTEVKDARQEERARIRKQEEEGFIIEWD